jgi:hypothetical protein
MGVAYTDQQVADKFLFVVVNGLFNVAAPSLSIIFAPLLSAARLPILVARIGQFFPW